MTLDPDPESMSRLGYAAVDRAVSHLANLRDQRVVTPPVAAELRQLFGEDLPRDGHGADDTLRRYYETVLPRATLVNHPNFFAYVPGPGSFVGALGAFAAAVTNPFVGTWLGGAALAQLELETLRWLRTALGLHEHGTGLFTSGGSMANLSALAAGLRDLPRHEATVYASDQGHYSLTKAARILGVPKEQVRILPTDARQRLDPQAAERQLLADRDQGLRPAVLCATAGTTSTGAVDPLPELAQLCRRHGLWLHVDAAYGGAMALLPDGQRLLAGWELADSVTIDPHKWLYVPFECGCLLVKDGAALAAAFGGDGDYMQDIPRGEANFFALGPELSRGARALKLWFLLRSCGIDAIAAAIRDDLRRCRLAHDLLVRDRRIEVITPPQMSIFTFAVADDDPRTRALATDLMREGRTMLSSTMVAGRYALRFCVANHRTTDDDVRAAVEQVRKRLG